MALKGYYIHIIHCSQFRFQFKFKTRKNQGYPSVLAQVNSAWAHKYHFYILLFFYRQGSNSVTVTAYVQEVTHVKQPKQKPTPSNLLSSRPKEQKESKESKDSKEPKESEEPEKPKGPQGRRRSLKDGKKVKSLFGAKKGDEIPENDDDDSS